MKKHSLRVYLCGLFTAFLLFALMVPSFAASVSKQLTAVYNGVEIYINGTKFTPKDANGNTVQPFVVDGTTYLPLRAVAGAVGYDVKYDASKNTVALTTKTAASASPSPSPSPTPASTLDTALQKSLISRLYACLYALDAKYKGLTLTSEKEKEINAEVTKMENLSYSIATATTNDQLAQYQKQVESYELIYK